MYIKTTENITSSKSKGETFNALIFVVCITGSFSQFHRE